MAVELMKLYEQWRAVQPLPNENHQALWQWIRLRFNHHSNQFEGNTLVYSETQLLLIHGRTEGDRTLREYEEMKAHNVAFQYVCELAKKDSPLTEVDIRDLNKICLKEPFYASAQTPDGKPTRKKIVPGKYKTQPNYVVTQTGEIFHFATPEETPAKLEELVKWIQEWLNKNRKEQHKILAPFLVELHQRFVHIHPFDDGNGRVVRLLLAYILIRLHFLPMVLNNREQYIKAIQFADAGNTNHLEQLFLENMALMLKQGIFAKNNKVDLNQEVGEIPAFAGMTSFAGETNFAGETRMTGLIRNNGAGGSTSGEGHVGEDSRPTLLRGQALRGPDSGSGPAGGEGHVGEDSRPPLSRGQALRRHDSGSGPAGGVGHDKISLPTFREDESSQVPALQLLQNMGWTYLVPEEALSLRKGDVQNILLEDILETQLKKINRIEHKGSIHNFKDTDITNAIHELKNIPFDGLIKTSAQVFDLLTLGTSRETHIEGDKKSYNLKYIDWENPANNTYHVTDEYSVGTRRSDESTRRPDIVLFINGIPVVVIECKRWGIKDPVAEAISQHIRNQKNEEIPHLFIFSQILLALCPANIKVATGKNHCKYGTTGTEMAFWYPWKEKGIQTTNSGIKELERMVNSPLSQEKKDKLFAGGYRHYRKFFDNLEQSPRQVTEQDIMLYGLCRPERVLEFIKQFILYDGGAKKIARYQQYFSVKDTIKKITNIEPGQNRIGGVVWHTQGSGKSLSMVLLAKAIAMEHRITEPKIILITDRVNLDAQIYKTFDNCNINLTRAKSGTHLINILKTSKETVIASTIFKFDSAANTKGVTLPSKDIIVLVDEAHRTQYGEASAKLRKVCPNACFIAYTGTPLTKTERHTMHKFGKVIGTPYISKDALSDKAIVPLLYEGRIVQQNITKDLLDRMFERITKDLSQAQKIDLKRKYNHSKQLNQTEQRIYMIAVDISTHFSRLWKNTGFKGMLATNSIATAFKYKKYFDEIGDISTEVIVSQTDDLKDFENVQEEETYFSRHEQMIKENFGSHKDYEREIISKFDSKEDPEILIVVDKLLTGFDVPRNTVLYLDKDIKEHTLLQATGRVNRIFKGKEFGYVIDYHGNLEKFLDAVAHYDKLAQTTQAPDMDPLDRQDVEHAFCKIKEEIDKLPQYYADLEGLFSSVQNKADKTAYEDLLFDKSKREEFYEKLSLFGNTLHRALSSAEFITKTAPNKIKKYKEKLKFFCKLQNHIKKVFAESIDYQEYEPKIKRLLDTYVQAGEIQTVVPVTNIYDSQLSEELKEEKDKSQALIIMHKTKKYISENLEKDPEFYKRLSTLLQETLDDYQQKRINERELLQKAFKFKDEALTRTGDNLPPALEGKEEAKAFFGVLKKALSPDDTPAGAENKSVSDSSKRIRERSDKQTKAHKDKLVETKNKESVSNTLAEMSIKIAEIIKKHCIVDWVRNRDIHNKIKNEIEDYLLEQKESIGLSMDFDSIDRIMEETIKIAKSHYL